MVGYPIHTACNLYLDNHFMQSPCKVTISGWLPDTQRVTLTTTTLIIEHNMHALYPKTFTFVSKHTSCHTTHNKHILIIEHNMHAIGFNIFIFMVNIHHIIQHTTTQYQIYLTFCLEKQNI